MRHLTLISALMVLSSAPAAAQPDPEVSALKKQVEELTKRVAQLEAEKAQGANAAPSVAAQSSPPAAQRSSGLGPANFGARPTPATAAAPAARGPASLIPPAPLDKPLQPAGLAFQVSAGSGSGEVSIKAAIHVSDPHLRGRLEGTATDDTIALTASAPVDEN